MYNKTGSVKEDKVTKPKIIFDPNEEFWVYEQLPTNPKRIHFYDPSLVTNVTTPQSYGSLTFKEDWSSFRITTINLFSNKSAGIALIDTNGTLNVIKNHGSNNHISMNSNPDEPLHVAQGHLRMQEVSTTAGITVDVSATVEGVLHNKQVGYPNRP